MSSWKSPSEQSPGGREVAVRIDQHEEPVVLEHQGVLGETLVKLYSMAA